MASTASITFLPCIRLCSTAEINFYFYASWTSQFQFVSSVSRSLRQDVQDAREPTNQHCQVSLRFPLHGGNSIQHQCQNTCSTHSRNKQTNNTFELLRKVSKYKNPQCTSQFTFNFILAPWCLWCMFRFGNSEVKIGSSRVWREFCWKRIDAPSQCLPSGRGCGCIDPHKKYKNPFIKENAPNLNI